MKIYTQHTKRIGIFFILSIGIIGAGSTVAHITAPQSEQAAAAGAVTRPHIAISAHDISAQSAIVWDIKNDRALFAKNAESQLPLASITKLMLGLVAIETLSPNVEISISNDAIFVEGDSGLLLHETWQFSNLLKMTLVASSNDGAYAIATAVGTALGNIQDPIGQAVAAMNARARELQLTQTYFINTSGLDTDNTTSGAYGSARDIAQLLDYITTHHASLITPTRQEVISVQSNRQQLTATNTNDAIPDIPGLIGAKTGYTDLAGGNLAVAFDVGIGHPIAIVVLGATQETRFSDIETLVRATRMSLNTPQ